MVSCDTAFSLIFVIEIDHMDRSYNNDTLTFDRHELDNCLLKKNSNWDVSLKIFRISDFFKKNHKSVVET